MRQHTPRTDELQKYFRRADDPAEVFEFARLLERELKEAQRELAEARDLMKTWERHAAECQASVTKLEKINGLLRGAFPHVTDASEGAKAQEPTKERGAYYEALKAAEPHLPSDTTALRLVREALRSGVKDEING
jgi:hypothetical protein